MWAADRQFGMQLFNFNDVFFHRQLRSLLDVCVRVCVRVRKGRTRETHWTHSPVINGSIQIFSFRSQRQMKALQSHLPPSLLQPVKGVARRVC